MASNRITAQMLGDALGLGRVPDEEVREVISGVMTFSRWEEGNTVSYSHPEQGHAFDLVYNRDGEIALCEPAAGLTPELLKTLREHAKTAFASDAGFVVWREVLFSVPEVRGSWRHRDDWQLLPAPPQAPRPPGVMGEHPFVLEQRVHGSTNRWLAQGRRFKRLWELHLVLSLLLRGSVTREWPEKPHHWMLLHDPTSSGAHTAYLNEGYMVGGGFVYQTEDLSDPTEFPEMTVVPDAEYYRRRGIGADDSMEVPACLDEFFDRFESADPLKRDQLLRACYWRDLPYRVWHTSKSLSFIAAINAIESLFPRQRTGHQCPVCNRHHDAPGPTARFREFVEKYAASESTGARSGMYNLRSLFVHGSELHAFDLPRMAPGALVPAAQEQYELHNTALAVSRTAIRTWFLDGTTGITE